MFITIIIIWGELVIALMTSDDYIINGKIQISLWLAYPANRWNNNNYKRMKTHKIQGNYSAIW